jgi:hypothetical protein
MGIGLEGSVNRKDIEQSLVCVSKGSFGKPDLNQVRVGERILMVKDVRKGSRSL